MKASETNFQPIIEGTKQYVVPLFQRPYSWDRKEWEVLWADLSDLCENTELKNHFIGSLVTMPTVSVPEGVAKFMLIDGQQRITTIFILLSVIRNLAKETGQEELANEISQTMLVNPFKKGADYFKLLPTHADREAYKKLISEGCDGDTQIGRCYQFYKRKLNENGTDLKSLTKIINSRLSVVSIVLDHDDNPHLVFESLNAKGRPLTQADLIRNYFFMRIHVDQQEELHEKYWQPMQLALGDNLTECIRHYLMRNGSIVKQNDVYFTLKDRVGQADAFAALKDIAMFAGYYEKLIKPEKEANTRIQSLLTRINRLEVTTAYPFLLNCYHDYSEGRLNADNFEAVLQTLENFVIRRFVCNIPTSELNKIFPQLYAQALIRNPASFPDGVQKVLQSRGYPKDSEFRTRLIESKLYGAGERTTKTKLILESLESSFGHHEQVPYSSLTIEHVLPQTLTEWWQEHLGDEWLADHELYLHTLGNLTLTAYNSELSNDSYPEKKVRFATSHVELNRYFELIQNWNRESIEARSKVLAEQAIRVWGYFGEESTAAITDDAVTGKIPKTLTMLGQKSTVTSWRDVLTQTMDLLAELEPESFQSLAQEYPRLISQDPNRFRRNRLLSNGYYIEVNLSAKDIYRFCTQAIESVGLTVKDWVVEVE
jgi:uncharacterized protein with ParB-like and HNH nuclease domain